MSRKGHDLDMPKDPEGIFDYSEPPKSFEEHMRDIQGVHNLKEMIDELPQLDSEPSEAQHKEEISEARNAVLDVFDKEKASDESDQLISSSENRLSDIKNIRKLKAEDTQMSTEELNQRLPQETSILDISESF